MSIVCVDLLNGHADRQVEWIISQIQVARMPRLCEEEEDGNLHV